MTNSPMCEEPRKHSRNRDDQSKSLQVEKNLAGLRTESKPIGWNIMSRGENDRGWDFGELDWSEIMQALVRLNGKEVEFFWKSVKQDDLFYVFKDPSLISVWEWQARGRHRNGSMKNKQKSYYHSLPCSSSIGLYILGYTDSFLLLLFFKLEPFSKCLISLFY